MAHGARRSPKVVDREGRAPTVELMSRTSAPDPDAPPMAAATAALLHALGVQPADERDELAATFERLAAERGHDASVVGLRYGVLTVQATPMAATLLRYDLDLLFEQLSVRFPGTVERVVVHVGR
jgi:hypothetical protein